MKTLSSLLFLSLIAICLTGCGRESGNTTDSNAVKNENLPADLHQPKYGEADPIALTDALPGGTFSTWGGSFPKSLNMFLDYNRFSANIMGLMYEPLISLHSKENRPVGVLAESWEVGEDQMSFTFKIRK